MRGLDILQARRIHCQTLCVKHPANEGFPYAVGSPQIELVQKLQPFAQQLNRDSLTRRQPVYVRMPPDTVQNFHEPIHR
jgi:hypothetical protein